MAEQTDNPKGGESLEGDLGAADAEAAAERLEIALERIAVRLSEPRAMGPGPAAVQADFDETALSAEQIAERLDSLIGRLRAALGQRPE